MVSPGAGRRSVCGFQSRLSQRIPRRIRLPIPAWAALPPACSRRDSRRAAPSGRRDAHRNRHIPPAWYRRESRESPHRSRPARRRGRAAPRPDSCACSSRNSTVSASSSRVTSREPGASVKFLVGGSRGPFRKSRRNRRGNRRAPASAPPWSPHPDGAFLRRAPPPNPFPESRCSREGRENRRRHQ